jgi:hypothetical protein
MVRRKCEVGIALPQPAAAMGLEAGGRSHRFSLKTVVGGDGRAGLSNYHYLAISYNYAFVL